MAAFRFRKKTDYGLSMLALLYKSKDKYVSASEMEKRGLPRSFLVKIAQDMVRTGIIGAKEGRGGGYYLKVDPKNYTLSKVVGVLEGGVGIVDCVIHGAKCPLEDKCPQKVAMRRLNEDIEEVLEKYTISDLC